MAAPGKRESLTPRGTPTALLVQGFARKLRHIWDGYRRTAENEANSKSYVKLSRIAVYYVVEVGALNSSAKGRYGMSRAPDKAKAKSPSTCGDYFTPLAFSRVLPSEGMGPTRARNCCAGSMGHNGYYERLEKNKLSTEIYFVEGFYRLSSDAKPMLIRA
ncbi:hypothetical protein M407DRAFT_3955 [Tulasnella calospora MUT 4182]|uniref:Uncharacterized protein n=1 Tax=Tulasnella calospora MUT 4182 TaxID=1051891 RepID=A0A0C3LHF8_9AGAM|nr:hypothetical protein M407DRAFT_3955 [Tulasnella calospora MUT 4182]